MFFKVLYPKIEERVRQRLEAFLAPYQKKISIPPFFLEEAKYLNRSSTIEEAYHSSDQARAVFRAYQLHACDHCSVRFDETYWQQFRQDFYNSPAPAPVFPHPPCLPALYLP